MTCLNVLKTVWLLVNEVYKTIDFTDMFLVECQWEAIWLMKKALEAFWLKTVNRTHQSNFAPSLKLQ